MEEPPGSIDDLQPQDLSTSGPPAVLDLTHRGDECVLSAASLDALRRVTGPGWYQNSRTSTGSFPQMGMSDITLPPRDQVQPDNAFSHTTVTLSYVSRSRVFSHDSLSFSVPPGSLLALQPPCEPDKGLVESDFPLNQHYVEQVEGPVDLAAQALLQSLSEAAQGAAAEISGGVCRLQGGAEFNGHVSSTDSGPTEHMEKEHSVCWGLENGQRESWSRSEVCAESSTAGEGGAKEDPEVEPEVVFLLSRGQAGVLESGRGCGGVGGLCSLSPLDEPPSPSNSSQDTVDGVFVLPQASSSPSGQNSFLETTEEVPWQDLNSEGGSQPVTGISDGSMKSDLHDLNKHGVAAALLNLTQDLSENTASDVPLVNGNKASEQGTAKEKRLPMRSGRGTRLDSIVMNIHSSRYKVSGSIRSNRNTSQKTAKRPGSGTGAQRTKRVSSLLSGKSTQKAVKPRERGKTKNGNNCRDSTSDSGIIRNAKKSKSTQSAGITLSHEQPELLSVEKPRARGSPQKAPAPPSAPPSAPPPAPLPPPAGLPSPPAASPPPPSSSQSPKKLGGKAAGKKASPTAKPPHRRKKKARPSCSFASSMYAPKEPEIKLKYVNFREEKREPRSDSFSPFVRVQRQQESPSLYSVVNYPEEVKAPHRMQPAQPAGFLSAAVPSSSCLLLGRRSTHGSLRRSLVCCLCRGSANAMDLGDLHGPYYPEGYRPGVQNPVSLTGLKEDSSDSDSSSCNLRGRGRKCALTPRLLRAGVKGQPWSVDKTGSPVAKRACTDGVLADAEDWYSPPVLPVDPCEYWLHEDCGIWSAGVFLVRGRVYGLEEAVKAAQEMTCSACQDSGASLGCFFKGCPNKYHYRCALQSDCILVEENFSMKCKKHKNKSFRCPAGSSWDHSR